MPPATLLLPPARQLCRRLWSAAILRRFSLNAPISPNHPIISIRPHLARTQRIAPASYAAFAASYDPFAAS
ncbi:hypothetical protein [Persicirhabdus sediminis]|uniref:hypothetical protein n=1 Tax=Persicirhabdus sediminis TaxID=454144 RepID=UPI001F393010|nr:hypothetical protein [Persicirhabdus sediminis]